MKRLKEEGKVKSEYALKEMANHPPPLAQYHSNSIHDRTFVCSAEVVMKFLVGLVTFAGAVSALPQFGGGATTGKYKSSYSTDPSLPKHTIYMPTGAPANEKFPVLIWGNGGCRYDSLFCYVFLMLTAISYSGDGTSFKQSLLEVASHGYLAIANGAPSGSGSTTYRMGVESLNWLDKNAGQGKYANVDKSKVAVAGQSCGGLEAYQVGTDKRITTIGIMNSGQFSAAATASTVRTVTKPIFYFLGGSGDIAYANV